MSTETRYCKHGHKKVQVGRGDKKRWVCNRCRAAARRGQSSGRRRGMSLAYDFAWSVSGFAAPGPASPKMGAPAFNASYYDQLPEGSEE